MNALGRRIARMIRTGGPLSVATYMTVALHDPESGFYATRESIGAHGAFVTAPEVSQMFGELLGLWCAETWRTQGCASAIRLVELGPGRGTLIEDALRALRVVPEFLSAVEIVLIEASPRLEALQRERLKNISAPVRWARQWSDVAQDRPLFVIANEFFDALPIRQFVRTERGWCERMIAIDAEENLVFVLAPEPAPLPPSIGRAAPEPGCVHEISVASEALIGDLARAIAQRGGAALIVDYGHERQAFGDTLQAVEKHEAAGVLDRPGEADLSAHVDFHALAGAANSQGARVCGPVSQGDFLRALGIEARAERLAAKHPHASAEITAAIDRLTSPRAMGAHFKAMALVPPAASPPPGF